MIPAIFAIIGLMAVAIGAIIECALEISELHKIIRASRTTRHALQKRKGGKFCK